MIKVGELFEGKYEILKEIGKGGMSVVYLAMDKNLNKQWAVKEVRKTSKGDLDKVVINSFLTEAKLMKKLDHPALPRIVDIINKHDTICVVMDYIEGEPLSKVLEREGVIAEDLVVSWAKQICDALSYLHSQKPPIIYRDMKPSNVMLKPEGNIKIIDFGIAREYKEQNLADTTILGTPGYASPEQHRGQTDIRSDIFALGMTMHHLLTGTKPGGTYASVREYRPELSEGIELVINKCGQTAPENRYQTCGELLYDLENLDKITSGYRWKQKRRLTSFIVATALSVIFLFSGIGCNFAAKSINTKDYEELIAIAEATSLDEKVESYKKAINIYPNDTRAYTKLLEAYEYEGKFGIEENKQFLAEYNRNKENLDDTTVEVAELNYNIGKMYFNYYQEADGSYSFSNRVQRAYEFFKANFENSNIAEDFEHKNLSDCYYQICYFYNKYVFSSKDVEEASKEDYEVLFETIQETMEVVKTENAYDQLILYNGTFMFLYDQRASIVSVNVEQEEVLELMDMVYERANALSVQKEQSKKLQKEILDNYISYKEAINRIYINAEERS